MLRYTETLLGTLTIKQNEKTFEIQIREGNCLAVFIHVCKDGDGYKHTLFNFFLDAAHIKNVVKSYGKPFDDEVTEVRLNMRYKESYTLLKELVKHYPIFCYYE